MSSFTNDVVTYVQLIVFAAGKYFYKSFIYALTQNQKLKSLEDCLREQQ